MEPGYDFFKSPALKMRLISSAQACRLGQQHLGRSVVVQSLGSQQDQNFLLRGDDGVPVGVLKIANGVFSDQELAAQDEAARVTAVHERWLRVATAIPGVDGRERWAVDPEDPSAGIARVLKFLPGPLIGSEDYVSPAQVSRVGEIAGRVSTALATFSHPGQDRRLQWNPQHADRVAEALIGYLPDEMRRNSVAKVVGQAWASISAIAEALPEQATHLDLTTSNLICAESHPHLFDGIVDYGDFCKSWAVAELAVSVTSILAHPSADPRSTLPAVTAFDRFRPLADAEIEAVWPLVVLRAAILVLSGSQQVHIDPGNSYAVTALAGEWRIFNAAVSIPTPVMTGLIRHALGKGKSAPPIAPDNPILEGEVAVIDLKATAAIWDGGRWADGRTAENAARAMLRETVVDAVATRYGSPRPMTIANETSEAATVPTGIELWCRAPTPLIAPWDGTLGPFSNGEAVFSFGEGELVIAAAGNCIDFASPRQLLSGDVLGTACAGAAMRLQLRRYSDAAIPFLVPPGYAAGWLALTADPGPLIDGMAPGLPPPRADLLARRKRRLASAQEHYFEAPPQIERGWRHHVLSLDGRSYLDMVNNVALVGHSHPRIAAAVNRQLDLLNTNSRFHYSAIVDFTERLCETLPEPLTQVFLVNSGSEANDLALRLAMAATGRRHVLTMGEAYHGWTSITDAVSTSQADNPQALTTRPPWVHLLEPANTYRGRYRNGDGYLYAAEAANAVNALVRDGGAPAALLTETVYGNAGGLTFPDGYLKRVYRAVRSAGGLTIADEVQVGYGRLGQWFWGFQQQQVIPDIVTMAKAAGNGYPLGAVITTPAIASGFATQGSFFSSTGGSPVACVVGRTVLDIIRDEQLQDNASHVGGHLKSRLTGLIDKHPIVGAVHGHGLYLGVELVRDNSTLEAATYEAAAICQRLLDNGIIVQPTGDRMCVLKIKPPLTIDVQSADFFVDTLDKVITEGW